MSFVPAPLAALCRCTAGEFWMMIMVIMIIMIVIITMVINVQLGIMHNRIDI